tara:strand:+ start:1601 stop:2371 length:771 start_codon:yes stop_codon:yes gene_type:complete
MKNLFYILFLIFNINAFRFFKFNNIIKTSLVSIPLFLSPVLSKSVPPSYLNLNNEINYTMSNNENIFNMDTPMIRVKDNEIFFYGPVTHSTTRELKHILLDVDTQLKQKNKGDEEESTEIVTDDYYKIHLHLQSMGGSLMDTWYIMDLLKNLDHPVYTYIDGYAASAATLISVMGEKRFISPHSFMLIHQLSSGSSGTFSEMDDSMQNNIKFMETIRKIYLTRTLLKEKELNEILKKDLWLDAETCKKYGLIDEIK